MPESSDAARLQQIRERIAENFVCLSLNTAIAGRPHNWMVGRRSGLRFCSACGAYRHDVESDEAFLLAEVDRLTAALGRHATCTTCGHEQHRHARDGLVGDWCQDCTGPVDDLHVFAERTPDA